MSWQDLQSVVDPPRETQRETALQFFSFEFTRLETFCLFFVGFQSITKLSDKKQAHAPSPVQRSDRDAVTPCTFSTAGAVWYTPKKTTTTPGTVMARPMAPTI